MRVCVDTNILIDYVCQRKDFADAANRLVALGYIGKVKLQVSALSYVTAMFVAHKYGHDNVKNALSAVSQFVEVLDLQATIVVETLASDWKDYEDATQNATALKAEADCIVTRNKKDFSESSLPVYAPAELLELLSSLED